MEWLLWKHVVDVWMMWPEVVLELLCERQQGQWTELWCDVH